MTRYVQRTLGAGLILALCAAAAGAQCTVTAAGSCTQTRAFSMTVQRTVRVTVTPTTATLGNPTVTDFDNGFSVALGQTAVVKANNSWQILISSSQTLWTAGGGGRANKPRADLLWSTALAGTYTAISGTATQVATGTATASTSISLYYKIIWAYNLDIPGSYTLPVTITVSAP